MLAVKLALALLLLKSEPILPSSRLPEWLQVLKVWYFRSLNNLLLFVMYYLDFWAWFCSLISMFALFLRDACSRGSSGPSPVGNVSRGFWLCCWAWHGQLSTPLQEEWVRSENMPFSICSGLELFEHVPSPPPFQSLRSRECCCGCMLRVLWHRGICHSLCEMRAIKFAAPAWLDGRSVFTTLVKSCDRCWLQGGLLTCGKKIKCHCEKFLQTSLGLFSLVVPGPLWS